MPGVCLHGGSTVSDRVRKQRRRSRRSLAISGAMSLLTVVATVVAGPSPAQAVPVPGPATVTAVAGRRLIVVNWTVPSSGTVNHYTATVGGGVTPCTKVTPFSGGLTCTFSGLTANVSYTPSVSACPNAGNETNCSLYVDGSPVVPGPPAVPLAPTAEYNGNPNAVTVTWPAPSGASAEIASYRVTPSSAAGVTGLTGTCLTLVTSGRSCGFAGLQSGSTYTFKVLANGVTTAAGSTGSSVSSVASNVIMAGPPGTPLNVVAEYVSPTSLKLTWDEPDGGAPVGRYV